ncbi:GSCOCG00003434001-RA-CDS [Cotesia congregata]|uniref:Phospholipase A2 n=1 Tax=Cotesia congregata TaxID=51543 RepID=A0A8J2MYV4_COTCN|nr:GSCOCG00003434001-RA-CDS [Cotesia congregata]CAG5108610.1 Similar to Acidic phospholipase A2 PA4 (Heloderma suspectum) [Cotesia congregata]
MSSGVKVLLVLLELLVTWDISLSQPLLARSTYKGLRGVFLPSVKLRSADFKRAVYYHDQAVAVVDINENNEMLNCDIIEVYEPNEAGEVLGNLSISSHPTEIAFSQMTSLMYRCEMLDRIQRSQDKIKSTPKGAFERANMFGTHALNLFSGILPGTKWCGTGDIAENYHDLGSDTEIDQCCRTHDLCPVKIRAQQNRYNLTNYSLYSKSHCDCDNAFYQCLKNLDSPTASIMGKLYFNVVKVGCIEDLAENINALSTMSPRRRFSATRLSF